MESLPPAKKRVTYLNRAVRKHEPIEDFHFEEELDDDGEPINDYVRKPRMFRDIVGDWEDAIHDRADDNYKRAHQQLREGWDY